MKSACRKMLRATVVNCSSSCLIAAIWISFSRAIAFSGMVALSNTSESNSTPSFTSGLVTSTRNVEAIVAGVARNRATDCFDLVCNLFRGARFGSFQQHLRHQARDAVCLRRFGEKAAAKNGAHRNQRQPRIFAHQKPQSIR